MACLPSQPQSMPEAGGRTGPEATRARELSLLFISCSTQENGPYSMPEQQSRTGPEGVGVTNPEDLEAENWPSPLPITVRGKLARAM